MQCKHYSPRSLRVRHELLSFKIEALYHTVTRCTSMTRTCHEGTSNRTPDDLASSPQNLRQVLERAKTINCSENLVHICNHLQPDVAHKEVYVHF